MAKKRRAKKKACLAVKSNSGRKTSGKTKIVTTLGSLRRMIGAARNGKKVTIKARRAR